MQLEVINNTAAVAPNWAYIKGVAHDAFRDHCCGADWLRVRKAKLLTEPGANTKLAKGSVPIYGLTLAPAGSSGYQLCPWRSPECEAACLGITSGRSKFSNVREARINKTRYLMEHPYDFFRQLYAELAAALTSMVHHSPSDPTCSRIFRGSTLHRRSTGSRGATTTTPSRSSVAWT